MRYFYALIIFGTLFASCKKNGHSYKLNGIIYNNCEEREPIKNEIIQLFKTKDSRGTIGEIFWRGKTDSAGRFSINYEGHTSNDYLKLKDHGYSDLMTQIPANENLENIVVFVGVKANVQVYLNVINPHSLGDTMNLKYLGNSNFFKIPCPLQSGLAYTVLDYSPINSTGYYGTGDFVFFTWTPDDGYTYGTNFMIDKYCADTVRVVIDVN